MTEEAKRLTGEVNEVGLVLELRHFKPKPRLHVRLGRVVLRQQKLIAASTDLGEILIEHGFRGGAQAAIRGAVVKALRAQRVLDVLGRAFGTDGPHQPAALAAPERDLTRLMPGRNLGAVL